MSTLNNNCSISVVGVGSGIASIEVIATDYATQAAIITVNLKNYWIKMTGGPNQPQSLSAVYGTPSSTSIVTQDNSSNIWTYNGTDWVQVSVPQNVSFDQGQVYGDVSPTFIEALDGSSYPHNLWEYNGESWTKLTGGSGQPLTSPESYPSFYATVVGVPTPSFTVFQDENGNLWTYNGESWTPISEPPNQIPLLWFYGNPTPNSIVAEGSIINQPNFLILTYNGESWNSVSLPEEVSVESMYGNPTPDFIAFHDGGLYNVYSLWVSIAGESFTKMTGGAGQPPSLDTVYGNPTESFILMTDQTNQLWLYNGASWSQVTGIWGPQQLNSIYGSSTPTSVVSQDQSGNLWIYTGNESCSQISGQYINQPTAIIAVYGNSTTNSILAQDSIQRLWYYNGSTWNQIPLGNINQPAAIKTVYGNPRESFIVAQDESNNLWIYNTNEN